MSRVLDELRRDHRNMAKILAILERQVQAFREGQVPDFDLMQHAMDYCLDYPDLCHHPKEDVLFARLIERLPAARQQVDRLLGEHRDLARATRAFAGVVHDVAQDFQMPRDRFIAAAQAYISLNRSHMLTEERELFPLALRSLDDADWRAIDEAAQARPDPVFGRSVEERYLSLHARLTQLAE